MKLVTIYGIRNCDTMKKAISWLDKKGITYDFTTIKNKAWMKKILKLAIAQNGWKTAINRNSITWRELPDAVKQKMDEKTALKTAMTAPSLIKRPLLVIGGNTYLGFNEKEYSELLE